MQTLQSLRQCGHELIVVDGGSEDKTIELAMPLADNVMTSNRGRARQMNAGAQVATGDIHIFLHADTRFDCNVEAVFSDIDLAKMIWGRFDVKLTGKQTLLRLVEYMMNLRSRYSGIATGDQSIFVNRKLFEKVGGFPDIPLMEDIAISKRLNDFTKPLCLTEKVITSSRRWEEKGILKTILKMWSIRFRYALGQDPSVLAKEYV